MDMLLDSVWAAGLAYPEYRKTVVKNADAFDEVYAEASHTAEDLAWLSELPALRLLALGEDWCPDVYHTLPTWARLAEALPGWEMRIFPRDRHPEVMAPFVWKGGALRIPVYAFYSQEGHLQAWWSGRGAVAQRAIDGLLAGRTFGELHPDERLRVSQAFEEAYRRDLRRANLAEILAMLKAFFHR
jgi:hypothetical protein